MFERTFSFITEILFNSKNVLKSHYIRISGRQWEYFVIAFDIIHICFCTISSLHETFGTETIHIYLTK